MSVRLAVILCQAGGGSPARRDREGDLVARLIGLPGLDLSLIGPLEELDPEGTDRLLLGGMLGDLAILSWFKPEQGLELCHRNGVRGFRASHSLDESGATGPWISDQPVLHTEPLKGDSSVRHSPAGATATDARRLYFFNLGSHSSETIVIGLQGVLQARRTQTVPILVAGKPIPLTSTAKPPVFSTLAEPIASLSTGTADAILKEATGTRKPREFDGSSEWDQLVEELNDLDI